MENRGVVGPDEDPGQRDGLPQAPRARRLVVAFEPESLGSEADADGGAGQDGPEARLVEA